MIVVEMFAFFWREKNRLLNWNYFMFCVVEKSLLHLWSWCSNGL